MTLKNTNADMAKIIKSVFGADEILSDWFGLTHRQILVEIERCFPEAVIYWGTFNLDSIFNF